MSGLEGTSTCWTGLSATVLVLIIVWTALIAGLRLIVQDKMQAEDEAQSEVVRRVESDLSCTGCRCPDPLLVHWLPESEEDEDEPSCVLVGEPAAGRVPEGR
jgi:hypothetical protein